jgi:hypothetical protein
MPGRILVPALLALILFAGKLSATDYANRRANAVSTCEKIDAGEHQTGLLMNPDGYRSYYVRSECLQKAAVQFRDQSLCSQVRRRWSLFFSSWGISDSQCSKLVSEAITKDRAELQQVKQQYVAGAMRLISLRLVRNGNGRDFDFLPEFSGTYAHGYTLVIEILPPTKSPVLVHSSGYYVDSASNLRIYVRQSDIRARFPEFELDRRYTVRATLTLDIGSGGMDTYWSDEFLEQTFPTRERTQAITQDLEF